MIAVSDGDRLYAARYASGPFVNSLFVSEDARSGRALYADDERFSVSRTSRAGSLPSRSGPAGLWREVPARPALIVQPGERTELPFRPAPRA